jgi:response regulator RpfG family c-di-GMP phosphodiesterase
MGAPEELNSLISDRSLPVVLCVDDDPQVLEAIQRTLRNEAYQVVTVPHADGALDWLEALPVRLVIADEHMPRISGTELLLEVRRRFPWTAKILLTGFPGHRVQSRSKAAGVDALLLKPWDEEALRQTVRRILSRGESHPPSPGSERAPSQSEPGPGGEPG